MRYEDGHGAQTRQRIIDKAAELFRRDGFQGTGIARIMKELGLTVGGFYKHFDSKAELFSEAVRASFAASLTLLAAPAEEAGTEHFAKLAEMYLSAAHRDRPERGCPLPALTQEVARAEPWVREAYEGILEDIIAGLARRSPGQAEAARRDSWAFLALLVGGLLLARGVASPEGRDEVLEACRAKVSSLIE